MNMLQTAIRGCEAGPTSLEHTPWAVGATMNMLKPSSPYEHPTATTAARN
eukprot:CAMPEP_0183337062 /NCGR_PEP_ID=MMETSP0164_2-20130417/4859_1 /TAXON_ID=221442 /ORGANISM="Coccolithus pelagicus ssp braarudi, Strain PLY182g" /LENGTH=49 /DNA_ID=CAMNT_0025506705 /DNA_START=282 /DNA_END=431 /DNA_ORIENTATION=+